MEPIFGLIKPEAIELGLENRVYDFLHNNLFETAKKSRLTLTNPDYDVLYSHVDGLPIGPAYRRHMTSKPSEAFAVVDLFNGQIERPGEVVGETDPTKAKDGTIRAEFVKEHPHLSEAGHYLNWVHCETEEKSNNVALGHFFNQD